MLSPITSTSPLLNAYVLLLSGQGVYMNSKASARRSAFFFLKKSDGYLTIIPQTRAVPSVKQSEELASLVLF